MIKVVHFPAAISEKGAVFAHFADGMTLAEIITGSKEPVEEKFDLLITVGDTLASREDWHTIKPSPETIVVIRPIIQGGGQGGGKAITMILAAVAVVAASLILGPIVGGFLFGSIFSASVATALGTAVVGTVGSLLLNAIAPPAAPTALQDLSGSTASTSPNFSISGARNSLQPWGVVPLILGRHRIVPPLGARTYTELRGSSSQYLRMLAVWGYGRLLIEDIKIGDTSITEFDDVTVETVDGTSIQALTKFPGQVVELSLSILLKAVDGFQTRVGSPDADELSIDILFPKGLFQIDETTGKKKSLDLTIEVEYRKVGDTSWIARPDIALDSKKNSAFGRNDTWSVASRGQYEVRVRRATGDRDGSNQFDDAVWSALRTITNEDPIHFPKALAKTAIVIKATEQLNGVVDDLNAIVTSYASVWNGSSWIAAAPTNNPASLYRLLLQGPSISRPVEDAEINLDDLGYWFDFCEDKGLKFNMIIDFEAKLWDILSMICAAGLASPAIRDGKWTVVIDEPKTAIAGHYAPHNSSNFEGEIVYQELPHAWRCRFINEQNDLFVNDERVVYRQGFTSLTATIFEAIDLPGVTDPNQVYRLAVRHLAVATLRPQKYSFETGIQNLLVTRGDRIKFVHDAPEFGLGSGRIKSVIGDGGGPEHLQTIVVDNAMPMETGISYGMRIQRNDGSSQYLNLITDVGYQDHLRVLDVVLFTAAPESGDLFLYGEAGRESVDLLVKGIQALDRFKARLVCIDYAPEVFDVDSNVIPAFNSNITTPPSIGVRPPAPEINSIQSDISVAIIGNDGSIVERVLVSVRPSSGLNPSEVVVEGQAKFEGSDDWSDIFTQGRPDYVYIGDVAGGEVYDLRVRFKTTAASRTPGAVGPWTYQVAYSVVGKTDLPPNPIQLKLEGVRAVWTMPIIPLDLAGFEMRFNKGTSVAWDQGVPVQDNLILTTDYDLSWLKGGEHTLMVKSLDTGGRESEGFSAMVVDLGDPDFGNVVKEVDFKADGFGLASGYGTVTGGSIVTLNLAANVLSGFWGQDPDAPFWQEGTGDFWQDSAVEMTYETYYIPLPTEEGIDFGLLTTIQAKNYTISYRTDGDELFFTGNDDQNIFEGNIDSHDEDVTIRLNEIGSWRLWPGKLTILGRQRYHFRVITAPGSIQGIISEFTLALDVPDVIEEFQSLAVLAAGTRLPIAMTYDVIKTVLCTVQDDGGAAQYAKALDKSISLGPLIKCYNAAGSAVDGRIDARVVGYDV